MSDLSEFDDYFAGTTEVIHEYTHRGARGRFVVVDDERGLTVHQECLSKDMAGDDRWDKANDIPPSLQAGILSLWAKMREAQS